MQQKRSSARSCFFLPDRRYLRNLDLASLSDDMNNSTIGYSFLTDLRNQLGNGREKCLRRLHDTQQ